MRRRAIAIGTLSRPWSHSFATSESIVRLSLGSHGASRSNVHSRNGLGLSLEATWTRPPMSGHSMRIRRPMAWRDDPMRVSPLTAARASSSTSYISAAERKPWRAEARLGRVAATAGIVGRSLCDDGHRGAHYVEWHVRPNYSVQRSPRADGPADAPPSRALEKRRAALDEVLVELLLDRLADELRDLEDERPVLCRIGRVLGAVDRLAELDPPLRRQRYETERAEGRERRRDRHERRADQAREHAALGELGIDLLRSDYRDRNDRRARAQRHLDEASAAEALQPVALREGLARSAHPFGEHHPPLIGLQQARGVVRV